MAATSVPSGSVSHGFERMGLIEYPATAGDADKVLEAAIEAGADDVESDDEGHRDLDLASIAYTKSHESLEAHARRGGSGQARLEAVRPRSRFAATTPATLMKLIDALEEDDDVQTVWGNYDVPEEELEKLA